jgi:hypothetical protein
MTLRRGRRRCWCCGSATTAPSVRRPNVREMDVCAAERSILQASSWSQHMSDCPADQLVDVAKEYKGQGLATVAISANSVKTHPQVVKHVYHAAHYWHGRLIAASA